jgi:hypothetical protein
MMNLKFQKSLIMMKMTMKKLKALMNRIRKELLIKNLPPENAVDNQPRLPLHPSLRLVKDKLKIQVMKTTARMMMNQPAEKRKNQIRKRQKNPLNLRKDNGTQMSNLLTNANNERVI